MSKNLLFENGAGTRNRTQDLLITSQLLYQLSYASIGTTNKEPGDNLLSHGETPHYHRRTFVSLLSSRWNQVGPNDYRRQA